MPAWIIYTVGFLAQLFFSGRTLLQWIKSEKAKSVISPSSYWILSVMGAYLLCLYGWFRNDFAIIFGQLISYYIYLWNLDSKGIWHRISKFFKIILIATPLVAIAGVAGNAEEFVSTFFHNEEIPLWLLLFGSAGQVIFTLRFVYQWIYSFRRKESSLPSGFWIISLIGSGVIIAYGIYRHDPVLLLGQSFGFVAYARNLWIGYKRGNPSRHQ